MSKRRVPQTVQQIVRKIEVVQTLMLGLMSLTEEIVTPEIATAWLANNDTNRVLKPQAVNRYASDMFEGHWELKPVAICFLPNGSLGNGQHTLNAIVKTGLSQPLLIARNVPASVIAVMDIGAKRSQADMLAVLGRNVHSREVTLGGWVTWGTKSSAHSPFERIDQYEVHQEGIEWVCARITSTAAPFANSLQALLVRAYYCGANQQRLEEFILVMRDGMARHGDADSSAIRLRDYMAGKSVRNVSILPRAEYALHKFMKMEPTTKLLVARSPYFPLDDGEDNS